MKLNRKKSRLGLITTVHAEEKPSVRTKVEYTELVEPKSMTIADGIKLVFSVATSSDGETHMDIRTYIESEKYSGPTKKGINFHIENLEEFREILEDLDEKLQRMGK